MRLHTAIYKQGADVRDSGDVLAPKAEEAGLFGVCKDVLLNDVGRTQWYRAEHTLVGFMDPEEFIERLKTEDA